MTRPTPERLEEIRDLLSPVSHVTGAGICKIAIKELLAEMDALTAEYKEYKTHYDIIFAKSVVVETFEYAVMVKERADLRLAQKIDGIALASLNAKNAELKSRIEKLREVMLTAITDLNLSLEDGTDKPLTVQPVLEARKRLTAELATDEGGISK